MKRRLRSAVKGVGRRAQNGAHRPRRSDDRGSYLLLLRLDADKEIRVGRLGRFLFEKGLYVYVGSAMRNLSARMARHCRKTKRLHWHIDYLRREAAEAVAVPIPSSRREECEIADALSSILRPGPVGFGSSDCSCRTHLFCHPTATHGLLSFPSVRTWAAEDLTRHGL